MSKKTGAYKFSYQIITDCEDSSCNGKAVLTNEDGTLLFDTEKDAIHFIDYLGIDAQVEAI